MDSTKRNQIVAEIEKFLGERLEAKVSKEKEEKRIENFKEEFKPRNWIDSAARRVSQLEMVTHAQKFAHPDARGENLYSTGSKYAEHGTVGTHCVATLKPDVTGNAAALDVYKFLQVKVGEESIFDLVKHNSTDLLDAFTQLEGSEGKARQWINAFSEITRPTVTHSSDKLAKQVYWSIDDGSYHLLAPVFPTALVQALYERLSSDLSSNEAKAARGAHREGKASEYSYRDYPNIAKTKFGGTKPQNISQLNSERHGEAWLLPALPPTWKRTGLKPPCSVETIFGYWLMGFRDVREPVIQLREFLRKTSHNNVSIRRVRKRLTGRIIDEVVLLSFAVQQLSAGWSSGGECRLNREEALWLDIGRIDIDEAFAFEREKTDWGKEVAQNFARWLNRQLDTDKAPMGDPERKNWQVELAEELRFLEEGGIE